MFSVDELRKGSGDKILLLSLEKPTVHSEAEQKLFPNDKRNALVKSACISRAVNGIDLSLIKFTVLYFFTSVEVYGLVLEMWFCSIFSHATTKRTWDFNHERAKEPANVSNFLL